MIGRRPLTPVTAAVCMALALAASACSPDGATTGPSKVNGKDFAANLRLVSGDQQLGPLGTTLSQPIVVKVVDAGGQPVQGAAVTFSVRAGGGSINPAANVSGADGTVTSSWTMGTTLGASKVVALLTNNFVLDSATFTATAIIGAPNKFFKVSGDTQTSPAGRLLPLPAIVKVQDSYGNNVSGVKVTWSAVTGTVTPATDTTLNDGTASAAWKIGTQASSGASFQLLNATITGMAALTFSATATADTGRVLTVVSGGSQVNSVGATLATPLKVKLTDQYGNIIIGDGVIWNDSISPGATVSPLSSITDASGTATATWTLGGNAGPQVLRAKNGLSTKVTFGATATVGFSDVIAGNFQACGIVAASQRVYCWGAGDAGQLGKGTSKTIAAPTTPVQLGGDSIVGPFIQARQLTGGRNSFCSLSISRQLLCWGRVIGQSAVTNLTATVSPIVDPRQQILPSMIGSGEEHTCILDLAGLGFCTGTNFAGQLGDGSFASPTVGTYPFIALNPLLPAPQPAQRYSSFVAGKQHSCGFRQFNPALDLVLQPVHNRIPECWGQDRSRRRRHK